MYVCPNDHSKLDLANNVYTCTKCQMSYPIEGDIPVFTEKRGYWSNAPQDQMRAAITRAEEVGNWRQVVAEDLPEYDRHITPYFRGDIQYLFPTTPDSVILDAGSMWGGVTIPVAQYCKSIYAVDKTWESLRFLSVRAQQDGLENVHALESPIGQLPFPDNTFDHIILNGVLEWLATDDDVVLENDWSKKRKVSVEYTPDSDPEMVQLAGLQELKRVLKNDGSIYIAIENRIGFQYFLGYPDDHVNVRFVSFLPRWIANRITRKVKNHDYRTYLYSPNKLHDLLHRAGFDHVELYSSFPHYNIISRLIPFPVFDELGALPYNGGAPLPPLGKIKVVMFSLAWRLMPNPIRKHTCPSISLIARRGQKSPARIIRMLHDAKVIDHTDFIALIVNNRFADGVPANLILQNKNTHNLEFFCKVSRLRDSTRMEAESKMLDRVYKQLVDTKISASVPHILFSGNIEGIEIQVTKFEALETTEPTVLTYLLKGLGVLSHKHASSLVRSLSILIIKFWLKAYDSYMMKALTWLVDFHKATRQGEEIDVEQLCAMLNEKATQLEGSRASEAQTVIDELRTVDIGAVYLCTEHGDFDICNIFERNGQTFVVDFEHAVDQALPFFDLGNVLFSTVVQQWKQHARGEDLSVFASRSGWTIRIESWLSNYAILSGISHDCLCYLPAIAVIEQNCKSFPDSREPGDYPMYGDDVFSQMLNWRLNIK